MNNLLGIVIEKYASQWCNIIQPEKKQHYKESDLGPRLFSINSFLINTKEFYVTNYLGLTLPCTIYMPQVHNNLNCVIYLHANNGSRLSGAAIKNQILATGFAYVIFDFSGAGKSKGKFSTLGINESNDIICNTIRIWQAFIYEAGKQFFYKRNLLNRCMGAFAALYTTLQYPYLINGLVLDTPYYSIKQLFQHVISKRFHLPNFLIKSVLDYLKQKIISITNINMFTINLMENLVKHQQLPPCFFASSTGDHLVPIKYVEQLYQSYPGVKDFFYLSSNHSSKRPDEFLIKVCSFLYSISTQQQRAQTQRSQSFRTVRSVSPAVMNLRGLFVQQPLIVCQPPIQTIQNQYFNQSSQQ